MKFYSINYVFDNGEEYECHLDGEGVIDYYISKDLALKAFSMIDPNEVLSKYTGWMYYRNAEEYILEEGIRNDLPYKNYDSNSGFFEYYIEEIDIKETI